jgi:tetratricopeptide (TPR) repeat protein
VSDASPEEPRDGRIVTFYSYKGGTGRTMAMANVAWILAANGHRVLVADWDLESPGLHRFFAPFLDLSVVGDAPGVIDLVRDYEWLAAASDGPERRRAHIATQAKFQKYVIELKRWQFPGDGKLEYLSAGRQNRDYLATLSALDWDNFYEALNGGEFLDAMRAEMRRNYDYTLIDSRTGLSDVADVCTVQLPDILVDCFTLSTQGIEGAAQVAQRVGDVYGWRGIRVLPVPMRVDEFEKERVDASRVFAEWRFENLPAGMVDSQRREYWSNVEVPYRPYYAYEEMLAVFGDKPGVLGSMLSAYERITGYITDGQVTTLPPIEEELRNKTRALFERKLPPESRQFLIEFLPEDQIWAEWIAAVLGAGDYIIRERRLGEATEGDEDLAGWRRLTVASANYLAWRRSGDTRGRTVGAGQPGRGEEDGDQSPVVSSEFVVYVAGARQLPDIKTDRRVSLVGVRDEADAVDRLERLVDIRPEAGRRDTPLPRYPGYQPQVFEVRAKNEGFTGREQDLRDLRTELRSFSTAVVRPIALLGTAGVGKTSEALEYAYRFQGDYDFVGWIDCQRVAEVDHKVADLAQKLRDKFGVSVPGGATVAERARLVLDRLSDGETVQRWLLVYDNAEDIEAVRQYLPTSGGQVLITSQNQDWADQAARSLRVEVFDRKESILHLRRVVPAITEDEADAVADAVGDLPVAVAAVAAFLRDTAYPVADYLSSLAREPQQALALLQRPTDYPTMVAAAWDLPLQMLRDRSPAAARLLELCSVMAPNISLNLVYHRPMAELLGPYDPALALAEPLLMPRLVQEISKLHLLRPDSNANEIQVHQLIQAVVRGRMDADQLAATRADVQRLLLNERPRRDVDDPATWSRYRLLWPHLPPAEVVSSSNDKVRQLIIDRVRYIYVFRDLERGISEATEAANRWERMLAAVTDPKEALVLRTQLLHLRYNHANILLYQSRFEEARSLAESVLAEQVELLGADHPHSLMTAAALGGALRGLGRYGEALKRDMQTYPAWVRQNGESNERTLQAASNLAESYRVTGDMYRALTLDEDTHRLYTATLGERHPWTLLAARNLVRDRLEAGEYSGAVDDAEHVYKTCDEALGTDSPGALDAQMLLGIALRSAGREAEAAVQFDEALRRLTDRFGDTSAEALACRLSNAANLLSLERFGEAEAEIRPVLAEYQRVLGAGHPHVLVCHVNLASALRLGLRHDEAVAAIGVATEGLERVLGADHPYTLAAEMVDAVLRADHGDLHDAEEVETRVAHAMSRKLGPDHPDTLRCRANLLLTRKQRGQDTAAEREHVIERLTSLLGSDHPTIVTLREERRVLRALDPQPF